MRLFLLLVALVLAILAALVGADWIHVDNGAWLFPASFAVYVGAQVIPDRW